MDLKEFANPTDFLDRVESFLARNEEANSLFLGLLRTFCNKPADASHYFAILEEDGEIKSAIIFTGVGLILTDGTDPRAFVAPILAKGVKPPSVVGPKEKVEQFSGEWMQASGATVRTTVNHRIYSLREVHPPQGVIGRMIPAAMASLELASRWMHSFHDEAVAHEPGSADRLRQFATDRISEGRLFYWEVNGRPVSMAAIGRVTGRTTTINAVFTPPEFRRQGYASALVAALSEHAMKKGPEIVVLYTDLANPTSNRIYQDVGFRPVCDSLNLWFSYPD